MHSELIQALVTNPPQDKHALNKWKRSFARASQQTIPSDAELLKHYLAYCKNANQEPDEQVTSLLKRRSIRTLSGVAPVTVLTKPFPCPGQCVYCPTEARMPKSYLSNEPAAMRAVMQEFDPYRQVRTRLQTYRANGHPTDKCELLVLGGTWSSYPKLYQTWFITRMYEALNDGPDGDNLEDEPEVGTITEKDMQQRLLKAQTINETAENRAVGLCLETRPDHVTPQEVARLRMLGTTRIQIGLQNTNQDVLDLIKRGEQVEDTITANRLLREAGFKVDMHLMPNLPGATIERDEAMLQEVFENPAFKPDQLKLYPTIVNEYAELHQWWKDGRWEEYTPKDLLELCIRIKEKYIPYYTRINRLIRDIPEESIEAGNKITNLREYIQKEMEQRGLRCKCIRCREARNKTAETGEAQLFIDEYECAGGTEYFISYENADRTILYAFVRLRIPREAMHPELGSLMPDIVGAAHIRELHTYGKMIRLGESKNDGVQHVGFGTKLMHEAERIAREQGVKKIAIIAGVGVREYYRKHGYETEHTYVTKEL